MWNQAILSILYSGSNESKFCCYRSNIRVFATSLNKFVMSIYSMVVRLNQNNHTKVKRYKYDFYHFICYKVSPPLGRCIPAKGREAFRFRLNPLDRSTAEPIYFYLIHYESIYKYNIYLYFILKLEQPSRSFLFSCSGAPRWPPPLKTHLYINIHKLNNII